MNRRYATPYLTLLLLLLLYHLPYKSNCGQSATGTIIITIIIIIISIFITRSTLTCPMSYIPFEFSHISTHSFPDFFWGGGFFWRRQI